MTKDNYIYIEKLLKKYREMKSELEFITVMGIDYSKEKIQTSNINGLDNAIIRREELQNKLNMLDALMKVLSVKEKYIIEKFYKEGKTRMQIGMEVNISTETGVDMAKKEAIKKMTKVYEKGIKYL